MNEKIMIVINPTRARRPGRPVHIAEVPSPAAIRELTAEIRKSWSPRERLSRANNVDHHVELVQMPRLAHNTGYLND